MGAAQQCSREECARAVLARGLCNSHYKTAYRRGEFDAPVERTVAFVCPPEHRHGAVSTCYNMHGCRCEPCYVNRSTIDRQRAREVAYGRYVSSLVPAGPVRDHVLMLQGFGLGYRGVAAAAGIGTGQVAQLVYGRQGRPLQRISRTNATRILGVGPDISSLPEGARISSRGVQRRIQALMTRGWSMAKIGQMIGVDKKNFGAMMRAEQVTVRRHYQVAELYERLGEQGPSHDTTPDLIAFRAAKNYAERHGFLPPLAWDDIDADAAPAAADDVDATFDEVVVQRLVDGEQVEWTVAERLEAVRILASRGVNDSQIGKLIGHGGETIFKIRLRAGIPAAVGADRERIVA
jgi:hypothetical protein